MIVTTGWWFFTNPSEKYANVKLDHLPRVKRGENQNLFETTTYLQAEEASEDIVFPASRFDHFLRSLLEVFLIQTWLQLNNGLYSKNIQKL